MQFLKHPTRSHPTSFMGVKWWNFSIIALKQSLRRPSRWASSSWREHPQWDQGYPKTHPTSGIIFLDGFPHLLDEDGDRPASGESSSQVSPRWRFVYHGQLQASSPNARSPPKKDAIVVKEVESSPNSRCVQTHHSYCHQVLKTQEKELISG